MIVRKRIIGYNEFGKGLTGSMNERGKPDITNINVVKTLNQYHSILNEMFDKCYNGETNQIKICDINRSFFNFFKTVMKKEFIFKLSHKKPFDERDKIGVKCFRVLINIINLIIDKYWNISEELWSALCDCLQLFYPYSHSSKESRKITERILIGFCRYYRRKSIPGNQLYALANENRFCIELCFTKAQSEEIKVGAAIIICLSGSIEDDEELVDEARVYLRDVRITSSGDREYLGIDTQLIRAALSDETEINPEEYQSMIINRITKDEQIKEMKNIILKKNKETDDLKAKNQELERYMTKSNEDKDNMGKKIEQLNTTVSKLNSKRHKEKDKHKNAINKWKKAFNTLSTKLNKYHTEISKQTQLNNKFAVSLVDSVEKRDKLQEEIDELRRQGQKNAVNTPTMEDVGVLLQTEDGGS